MTYNEIKNYCNACSLHNACPIAKNSPSMQKRAAECGRLKAIEYELNQRNVALRMDKMLQLALLEAHSGKKTDHCRTCPRRHRCPFEKIRALGKQASCPYHNIAAQKELKEQYAFMRKPATIDPSLLPNYEPYQFN